MEVLLSFLYLLVALLIVWKSSAFFLPGLPRFAPVILLIAKVLCGLALAWIYNDYYTDRSTADMFKLFDDSRFMHEALYEKPSDFFRMVFGLDKNAPYFDHYYFKMNNWYRPYDVENGVYNDTRTLIRLNALVRVFSLGVYAVHILVWCLISLLGLSFIYKTFYRFLNDRPYLLGFAVFLMPSVLCWGSGVLKEGVVFLLMGIFISACFRWVLSGFRWKYPIMIVFAILGFYLLKIYILIALIPGTLALLINKVFEFKRVRFIFFCSLLIVGIVGANIQYVFPSINFLEVISSKQQAIIRLAYYTDAGSVLQMNPLEPNIFSFLRNLPEALFNAAFRPSIIDAHNALQWFAAFENAFILLCFILAIGLYTPQQDPIKRAAGWFCISFVLVLFSIMGLSTPILGTLVRFRMPAIPFLFIAFYLFADLNRLVALKNQLLNHEE